MSSKKLEDDMSEYFPLVGVFKLDFAPVTEKKWHFKKTPKTPKRGGFFCSTGYKD